MAKLTNITTEQVRHTDDMQDIISTPPSWLLNYGSFLFFGVLVCIVGLSAIIKYPDIVRTQLKIGSPNSAKPIVAKIAGKLVKLLIVENESVDNGQVLAFLESTANHYKVLILMKNLKDLQHNLIINKPINNLVFNQVDNVQFGELQSAYQIFFQEYLSYRSSIGNGFLVKKRDYLHKDLSDLKKQELQLNIGKVIQQRNYSLAKDEYEMHKKLEIAKVETPSELRQQETKFLIQKSPLIQTESALITVNSNYSAKQKEILELDNQIQESKSKFLQALNSLISLAEDWKSKYVLTASQAGKISLAGIVQKNQILVPNQEVFYINPGDEAFYGEMSIPQNNMGKVKEGQLVLVKLKSYPFEEYGMIKGKIKYIAEVPYKDSIIMSKVDFKIRNSSDLKKPIHLKQGMMADAEIVTQDATILQRIGRSFFKIIGDR